jgi:hypothetical protein
LTILAKISPKKKSRSYKSEERHNYLRGARESAHFSSQEKMNYLEWMPLENFADKKKPLSYIKAFEKMHKKLRHQLNIHKISGSYKTRKTLHPFNPFFLLKKTNMLSK